MAEGFGGADRAETAAPVAVATDMRTKAAMHRDAAHRIVTAVAGVVAGDVIDEPRRKQPDIAEPAAAEQHLVKGRHAASGRVAAAAWHARGFEFRGIVARLRRVGVSAALLLARRDTDKNVLGEP